MSESPNSPSAGGPTLAGSIDLHRVDPSKAPYTLQPVHFANGDVKLAGSLLVPAKGGRHPGVVMIPGSGPELRTSMMYIADYLARHGIEALIFDKRGCGESGGDWKTAGYEALASDACAALAALRAQAGVDAKRIGYFGHSQGAMMAPLVSLKSHLVNFIVAADGFGGTQEEQDIARVSNLLAESDFSPADRRKAMGVYMRFVSAVGSGSTKKRQAFLVSTKGLKDRAWYKWLAIPAPDSYWWTLYPKIGSYNSLDYWPKVKVPTLLVHGEKDQICPLHPGLDRVVAALSKAGVRSVTKDIVPGADHTLRLAVAPGKHWPHIAPGFLDRVAKWINAR